MKAGGSGTGARPHTVERAYALAREGHAITAIIRVLRREGYSDAIAVLDGRTLRRSLRLLRLAHLGRLDSADDETSDDA